jgi:hypothetical protein
VSTMQFIMDTNGLDNKGAFDGRVNSNVLISGETPPRNTTFEMPTGTDSRTGHGGISYIEQDIGGVTAPRNDATVGPIFGIRPASMRLGAFNGAFIGMRNNPVGSRVSGNVGRSNRASRITRANATDETEITPNNDALKAFNNPGLARLISRFGRGGDN